MAQRGIGAAERCALLARSRRVAVVGASPDPQRPSYRIFTFLRTLAEIEASPINPDVDAVDGVHAYRSLAQYAGEHGPPDIVNVFRRTAESAHITRDAIAAGARAIWFQLGVASDEAIALAETAGLTVVADCCIKVEMGRCSAECTATPWQSKRPSQEGH